MKQVLEQMASQLTAEVAGQPSENGVTAVVALKASAVVSLGFDGGKTITAEMLKQALAENLVDVIQVSQGEGVLESAALLELRRE